jgi:hypothetical protein
MIFSMAIDDALATNPPGSCWAMPCAASTTRVLALMAHNIDVPLALSNLAARAQVSAAHIHITRHLALGAHA